MEYIPPYKMPFAVEIIFESLFYKKNIVNNISQHCKNHEMMMMMAVMMMMMMISHHMWCLKLPTPWYNLGYHQPLI
jgi:hypothetical protein